MRTSGGSGWMVRLCCSSAILPRTVRQSPSASGWVAHPQARSDHLGPGFGEAVELLFRQQVAVADRRGAGLPAVHVVAIKRRVQVHVLLCGQRLEDVEEGEHLGGVRAGVVESSGRLGVRIASELRWDIAYMSATGAGLMPVRRVADEARTRVGHRYV